MNARKLKGIHVAVVLSLLYVAVLWLTANDVGYTRDEGYYFKAAKQYSGFWGALFSSRFFEAFSAAEIEKHFNYNWEHPPLVKLSQGITYHLFHRALGLATPATGYRIAGFLFAGLSMFATFLLGRELVSARVGLLAAALLAVIPRYFFDAHLACFDVAITAMWTLCIYFFYRAFKAPHGSQVKRALQVGVVFGFTLATKLNSFFLPFIFVAMWLLDPPARLRPTQLKGPSGGVDIRMPPVPLALWTCAIIGPMVFIAVWPWLWHETFLRIGNYIGFHLHHEHYPAAWFHELLVAPPFPMSFPFVMSVFTVPSPMLLLGGLGALVSTARVLRSRSLPDAVLLMAMALPLLVIAMPSSPIFGGVKHWYNAMPTLAILAARSAFWGVELVRERLGSPAKGALVQAVAIALMIGPGLLGCIRSHPNGIGYYNELAGGFRGGAELGMQRGFWGGLSGPLYDKHFKERARVFFNRTNYDSYLMYRSEGRISNKVGFSNQARGAQFGVHFEQPEHGEAEGEIWSAIGTRPIDGVYQDNVTLIQLYKKGPSSAAP